MKARSMAALAAFLLSGCITGRLDVVPPKPVEQGDHSVVVNRNRSEVWAAAIPRLGKAFFVINNLDQSSGLINVSYSGDPERFIDGGTITSMVENAWGPRTYTFPASRARQVYEQYANGTLVGIDRRMSLEGRINIILEELQKDQTRVTVNVRYILTKTVTAQAVGGPPGTNTETISFDSGKKGTFIAGGKEFDYWPSGRLEADVLAAFQ